MCLLRFFDDEIAPLRTFYQLDRIAPIGEWKTETWVPCSGIEGIAGDDLWTPDVTAGAGFGFVRAIERSTYHNEEKRGGNASRESVSKELTDRLTLKNTALELKV